MSDEKSSTNWDEDEQEGAESMADWREADSRDTWTKG